jgi:hypothetical protein
MRISDGRKEKELGLKEKQWGERITLVVDPSAHNRCN